MFKYFHYYKHYMALERVSFLDKTDTVSNPNHACNTVSVQTGTCLSESTSVLLLPLLRTLLPLHEPMLGLGNCLAGCLLAPNVSHAGVIARIIRHAGGFLLLA